jgi:hypothetical protein
LATHFQAAQFFHAAFVDIELVASLKRSTMTARLAMNAENSKRHRDGMKIGDHGRQLSADSGRASQPLDVVVRFPAMPRPRG